VQYRPIDVVYHFNDGRERPSATEKRKIYRYLGDLEARGLAVSVERYVLNEETIKCYFAKADTVM
jgi:hypothetical protein